MPTILQIFLRGLARTAAGLGAFGVGLLGLVGLSRVLPKIGSLLFRLARVTVRLPNDPVPDSWPDILERRVPLAARLPAESRQRLYRLIQMFLREIPIEGCKGLVLTEEMRVTIAAQACLLLLHADYPRYPNLRCVLVYPRTFVPTDFHLQASEIEETPAPVVGQAWANGTVLLSWDSVRAGGENPNDGRNVVLHEFAHVLDGEDGAFDGVPVLATGSAYQAWGYALANRFARHQRLVRRGRKGSMDPYGATSRAEFFAVSTEAFFEKPHQLAKKEPDLYRQLATFYGFDPVAQRGTPSASG
jgi:hypothetical protein